MAENKMKKSVRKIITIPIELDDIIRERTKKYGYTYVNDLIQELLELGLLKFDENIDIKEKLEELDLKLDKLINGE